MKRSTKWRRFKKRWIADHLKDSIVYCEFCNKPLAVCKDVQHLEPITLDHILPTSLYPDLTYKSYNIQVLCQHCNTHKHNYIGIPIIYYNDPEPTWTGCLDWMREKYTTIECKGLRKTKAMILCEMCI